MDLTPAEEELHRLLKDNAKDGIAENLHQLSLKHGLSYDLVLHYRARLEDKGVIKTTRLGLGCKCPLLIWVKNL